MTDVQTYAIVTPFVIVAASGVFAWWARWQAEREHRSILRKHRRPVSRSD